MNNFLLPVTVSEEFLKEIFDSVKLDPNQEIEVNLEAQTISLPGKASENFHINKYKKTCLLNGYDDIDYLLSIRDDIKAFERKPV
jgi:3-isopropylmalate/(R)-2-methylmalate dehydratase small subunit